MTFQGRLHRRPAALAAERKRSVKHSSWVRASASAKRFFAQIWQNCKLALTLISGSSTPRSTSTPSPSRSRGEARDGVTTTATFGIADYGSSSTSTTSARGLPWRHHHQPRQHGLARRARPSRPSTISTGLYWCASSDQHHLLYRQQRVRRARRRAARAARAAHAARAAAASATAATAAAATVPGESSSSAAATAASKHAAAATAGGDDKGPRDDERLNAQVRRTDERTTRVTDGSSGAARHTATTVLAKSGHGL